MLTDNPKLSWGFSTRSFVNVVQAAMLLRVSESTVRRRCRLGLLPAIRSGREWQVELEALRQLANEPVPNAAGRGQENRPERRS